MDFAIERHVVNLSARGRLGATGLLHTPPESLRHIFEGLRASGSNRLTIYFHGGLIDEIMGLELARLLYPEISENCDSYPVFFIWESGVLETIQSALVDVVESSPLFMRTLKHLAKALARLLPAPAADALEAAEIAKLARSIAEERLFLDEPGALRLLDARLRAGLPSFADADVLQLQRDMASDPLADRALGAIMAAARRHATAVPAIATAAAAPLPDDGATGYLSRAILDQLAGAPAPAGLAEAEAFPGGLSGLTRPSDWFFAGAVLRRVVDRFQNGTDHGFIGTIMEEMYRTLYADKVGRLLWDGMKANAAGAYDPLAPDTPAHETPGGSLFLQLLTEYQEQHGRVELNLIGHSAGSIHISHFVERGAQIDPGQFVADCVIFLAPACSFETFNAKLIPHTDRIGRFRIFTMADACERRDPLIKLMPTVYPHSLLYLVSGLLEDTPDAPLIGLTRHLEGENIPLLPAVRDFLNEFEPPTVVYAKTAESAPPGERTGFTSHYGLWGPDFDRATLDSVAHLLRPAAARDLKELSAAAPTAPPGGAPAVGPAPSWDLPVGEVQPLGPVDPGAVMEQIIGADDIVDHAIVDALLRAGKAVARIVAPGIADFSTVEPAQRSAVWAQAKKTGQISDGYGTGWILGSARRVLITNNHVLPLPEAAMAATVEFGFERDLRSSTSAQFVARLRPGELFITDPNMLFGGLDYTVVALSRPAPEAFSFLEPMQGITAARTANIFIVQHPNGEGKAYALNNSHKVSLPDRYVTYVSDTLEGSSGSALFDDRVRLVGIHHLGNYVENIGGVEKPVNLGSRIEFVIEDIATKLRAMPEWDEPKVREYFGDGMVLAAWRRLGEV